MPHNKIKISHFLVEILVVFKIFLSRIKISWKIKKSSISSKGFLRKVFILVRGITIIIIRVILSFLD
jgi:hypothetical protein